MTKLSKEFFKDKDILFVGYSSRNIPYSKMIFKAFTDNNIKVYPYNTKENAAYDIKVYKSLNELPVMPNTAYILLNKENTAKAVKMLADKGIKRILFYNSKSVGTDTLEECKYKGIETAIGCPMMVLGKGFHKFHALLAGVR